MKPFTLAFLAVPAFLSALPASAEVVDPLWSKTLAHAALVKTWAPEDKELSVDTTKDARHESFKTRSHLKAWEKGKPVYDSVQVEPKPGSGNPAAKRKGEMPDVTAMTDALMRPNAPVRRTEGQPLHGKTWTLFEVAESDGPGEMAIKLWVDPQTGVAHQVESKVHGPMMFDAVMTTDYAPHPRAGSLPQRMDLQLKVLMPFKKSTVHVAGSMDNWIRRPN